ncbi:hypothetical membrane protein [Anaerolinea thermophila UNI-1]|uniref:Hypothetical membrane protein n=1 Tax=Anaerolinea thermophila (strain DSM 14523 / JCM 11388 / NBRC 100420 / UNI-1) TaxID=926569 RepID=E8N4X2_ANATU|nr:hypothetical membrane protein [Anaerolinea thermophila UNI-1]
MKILSRNFGISMNAMITSLLIFFSGWLAGGLVNWLADWLPVESRLGGLICSSCRKEISWLDYWTLFPCKHCGRTRGLRTWLLHFGLGIAFLGVHWTGSPRLSEVEAMLWLTYSSLIVVIDFEHRLILEKTSIAGGILAFVIGVRLHGIGMTLAGGTAGAALLFLLFLGGEVFRRWMEKRRGEPISEVAMGFGDVILSGIIGLILGWPGILAGLFLAILAGGIVSGLIMFSMIIRKNYQAFTAIPYGPYLIFATLYLLFLS